MNAHAHYAIRGGVHGRARLRLIARILQPTTTGLFDRLGVVGGLACLDVGCGGGDVTLELAQRVGPDGHVVGVDIDETTLDLARAEAKAAGARNVVYRRVDIRTEAPREQYDLVHARFLLSHLSDPGAMVAVFRRCLRPGGLLIVEDLDASGTFVWPESKAHQRYRELYAVVVRTRGGDPDIGPRLPRLLTTAAFDDVDLHVVQPAAISGETKLVHALTMENIMDAVLADGLATRQECDRVLRELYACADDSQTVVSLPRIVQAWGRRGA